jgi:hypothetical protein
VTLLINHLAKTAKKAKMKKYCIECGQQFDIEPSQNYKTLCKPCFIESKKSELERLQNNLDRLVRENIRLRSQLDSGNRTTGGISPDLLKRLKQLPPRQAPEQPIKHGGF